MTDPAPRQQDAASLEARFDALFAALGSLPVRTGDPGTPRTGELWLTTGGALRACLRPGHVVTLAQAKVD